MTNKEKSGDNTNNPQYFYFYGSTDNNDNNGDNMTDTPSSGNNVSGTTGAHHQSNSSGGGGGNENDSLLGESLVPTDNEADDMPRSTQKDYQQLLVSHGNNGELRPLTTIMSGSGTPNGKRSNNGKKRRSNTSSSSDSFTWITRCCIRYKEFRTIYSGTHTFILIVGFALFAMILTLLSTPSNNSNINNTQQRPGTVISSSSSSSSSSSESRNPITEAQQNAKRFKMTFQSVGRENDPATNFINTDLFESNLIHTPTKQQRNAKTNVTTENQIFRFPFPTGAFWTNLVLPPTADRGFSYPIAVYPYAYKWSDSLLVASYPSKHRKEETKMIHDYFFPDLTFGVNQHVASRKIISFDPLSISLRYYTTDRDKYWETYLVQGSPYITIKYKHTSPVIHALSTFQNVLCPREQLTSSITDDINSNRNNNDNNADNNNDINNNRKTRRRRKLKFGVCNSNNDTEEQERNQLTTLRGVQFIIETTEGVRWMVFASEPINLQLDTVGRTTIVASTANGSGEDFSGVLRFAIVPPDGPNNQSGSGGSSPSLDSSSSTSSGTTALDQIDSTGLQRLIYHAGVYPVAASVAFSFRPDGTDTSNVASAAMHSLSKGILASTTTTSGGNDSSSSNNNDSAKSSKGRIGTIQFKFETQSFTPTGTATSPKSLLMLALPHHAQSIASTFQLSRDQFDLVYTCIKGPMRPILGSTWTYDESLPTLGFGGDSGSNTTNKYYLDPKVKTKILESLKEDVTIALPTLTENIYGFGKQSARLAQLLYIAIQINNSTSSSSSTKQQQNETTKEVDNTGNNDDKLLEGIIESTTEKLRNSLSALLTGKVADRLVYDTSLGGMVTSDGLLDSGADFGNGRYNDHHFHYGYILYACAIMGYVDPKFVSEFGNAVDAIFYDVANYVNFGSMEATGVFFPGSRHKVWFDGHSYASGMFPFGNGKSQESSSEAVNGYYGAYLWSLVRNGSINDPSSDDSSQTDFARLLLATEIRGARTYWHMLPPTENQTEKISVYSPTFAKNYMVGNIGMLDALCSTWFGTQDLYVHLINFIPVTSVTGDLFGFDYVSQEYSKILKPLGEVEMAWMGYLVANHAIVNPNAAWADAQSLFSRELDSAISKSQILYWISTRRGFDPAKISGSEQGGKSNSSKENQQKGNTTDGSGGSGASCFAAPSCERAGLTGDCCPTSGGIFLDCCSS